MIPSVEGEVEEKGLLSCLQKAPLACGLCETLTCLSMPCKEGSPLEASGQGHVNSHRPLDRKPLPELGSFPILKITKQEGKALFQYNNSLVNSDYISQ